MRGFLLAVALLATAALTTAVDKECVLRKRRGLPVHWPNPADCSSFYRCTNKNIKRELQCPEGKEYNPKTGRCGSKGKNLCQLSLIAPLADATNPCSGKLPGVFLPDAQNCRNFFICNNDEAYPQICDAGSYFNATVQACEPDPNSICWENLCVKKKDGVFVEDLSDCGGFFVCTKEEAVKQVCDPESYFNRESLNCVPGQCPYEEVGSTTGLPDTTGTSEQESSTTNEVESTTPSGEGSSTPNGEESTTPSGEESTTSSGEESTTDGGEESTTDSGEESTTDRDEESTTPSGEESTTTCASETTTTCTPETTTTPCVRETTTTTCTPETTTTTCTPTTTTCSPTTTTCSPTTTTCAPTTTTTCTPTTTTCSPTTTTTCTPTTTTCTPTTTTTTCTPTTTTCTPETTTTTCLPETTTTTCLPETTTTCAATTTLTLIQETTTCAVSENTNCDNAQCVKANDGHVFPAKNTTAGFCVCNQQQAQYRECPDDSIFNESLLICVAQDKVCPSQECSGQAEYYTFPASNTTTGFCSCIKGEAHFYECAQDGWVFDKVLGFCVNPSSETSTPCAPQMCEGKYQEGDFVPNPDNCMLFYICFEGKLVETSCEAGNYYDPQYLACLPDTEGKCPQCQLAKTAASNGRNKRSLKADKCVEGDFIPNPDNCMAFFICFEGQLIETNCEAGYYYNSSYQACLADTEGKCPQCQQPQPSKCVEGDFLPNPDNCMLYFICYEGQLVENSCETGYYYNSTYQACLDDTEGQCPQCHQPAASNERNMRSIRPAKCVEGQKLPAVDCDKYFKCSNGQKLLYGCGKNNFFNVTTLTCQFDSQNVCWNTNSCVEGVKTPYPADTSKYYECCGGQQVLKSCGDGNTFDKISQTCSLGEICTCPGGYQEGDLSAHPDPEECNKFYICIKGEQVLSDCGVGNYFDAKTLSCEKDVKGLCKSDACLCPGGYGEGDFSPHPQDCDKFYICEGGQQVVQECGEGKYFDNVTLTCEEDIYNECWPSTPCTCPGGYEEGDFSAHPLDCSKYYICSKGQQQLQDCGTNNYFNNDTLLCEPDIYHICWPNLCAGQANGTLVANPQQCNTFFLCESEEAIPQACFEGQMFDASISACIADLNAVCYDPCANETNGPVVLLPHPICNKFYFCNGGKTFVGECLVGSFDIATGVCNEAKKCYPNPCDNSSVMFFPDPYDPAKFFYCNDGKPIPQTCPAGMEFDTDYLACLKVSNPECPVCTKDGAYPTLDENDYSDFCVCVDGLATKLECPQGYDFNVELGTCYSNAPCDPTFCLEAKEYDVAPNRNDSQSFCMCFDNKPVIVPCPNNGTFNPYTLECSDYVISPECEQAKCIGQPSNTNVFLPLDPKKSNGLCVCTNQIATFRPCNYGSSLNSQLMICQLAEINCNSYQCRGLPDNTRLPAITTTEGYCQCVGGTATYYNCPNNGEFNVDTSLCEAPVCDMSQCTDDFDVFPALNTTSGFCVCYKYEGYRACPNGELFSEMNLACLSPCNADLCAGKPSGYYIPSEIDTHSFCKCPTGLADVLDQPTFEECQPSSFIFDESKQMCVGNAEQLCGIQPCTTFDTYEANNTLTGFCLCSGPGTLPVFRQCDLGIYVPGEDACLPTAEDVCDISQCASATLEQPITLPANNSIDQFCYCSSPTNAMLLLCPEGKHYNATMGMCVSLVEGSCLCPDGVPEGGKVADTTTCNKYSICTGGVMVPQTCPDGQYFNVDTNNCCVDSEGICAQKSDCTCLGAYYENEHLPHPVNPFMYYVCKNGSLRENKCPGRLVFSKSQRQCVRSLNQPQKRSIDFPSSNTNTNNDHEFICLENVKRSVPSNCSQYEICLDHSWTRKSCSNHRYYNPEQRKCLEPQDDFVCSYAKVTTLPSCNASLEQSLHEAKSCQQFYRCHFGKWSLEACERHQYFNRKLMTCVAKPSDFQCLAPGNATVEGADVSPKTCTPKAQRFYAKNCAMYLECWNNEWWYQYCPPGLYFNRSLNSCVADLERTCADVIKVSQNSIKEEFSQDHCQQDGLLRPSALACNRYFVCLNSKWQLQHCAPGEFYDIHHSKCSPDVKGVCTDLQRDCVFNERRSVPQNCSAYEQCSREGKWLRLTCSKGELYDDLLQKCSEKEVLCSKQGLRRVCRNQELMANKGNCSEFYYCHSDSWNLGKCLKGFMFSNDLKKCVAHSPLDQCQALIPYKALQSPLVEKQDNNLCEDKMDGISVAQPLDCSRYFICIQETQSHEMQCSQGSFFDSKLGYCRPNDGSCHLPLSGPCANATDNSFVEHPSDCQAYYKCSFLNGSELLNCPEGQYYHNITQQCRPDHGECKQDLTVPPPKCSGLQHGSRLPHETYCNIYYACVKGLAIPVECPDNYQFNSILNKCVVDREKQCQDGHLIDGNITYSCGGLKDGSYLPDRKDCTRYYICSQGQAVPQRCNIKTYFDSKLLMCVPDDGSCPLVDHGNNGTDPELPDPAICEGKHGYLLEDPFNCNNFYACIHNKLKHERCYDQHFFNKTSEQCQTKSVTESRITNSTKNTEIIDKNPSLQCLDKTTSPQQLCQKIGQGSSLAEPGDCRRYITCQENNEEPVPQRCRNGESFDSLLGFCRQNDGTCLLENGQRVGECNGKHGQLTRDANNCRKYFVCINGQKIAQTCESHEYFSKSQNMCLEDTQKVCNATTPESEKAKQSCVGLSESVLYPYINDNCRSYFQCIKGVAKIHKCADELYFDPLAIKCVKNKTECVMPTQTLQRSPVFSQTFKKLCLDKKLEYPYPNLDNDCRSFYFCHANGEVSHELCSLGMMFNKDLQTCSAESKTICK